MAIFHSNRSVMYSVIASRTTTSPIRACREICSPHVGPTTCALMSSGLIPVCCASASNSCVRSAAVRSVRADVRIETWSPPTTCTSAVARSKGSCASSPRTCSTVTSLESRYSISVPPVKSIE